MSSLLLWSRCYRPRCRPRSETNPTKTHTQHAMLMVHLLVMSQTALLHAKDMPLDWIDNPTILRLIHQLPHSQRGTSLGAMIRTPRAPTSPHTPRHTSRDTHPRRIHSTEPSTAHPLAPPRDPLLDSPSGPPPRPRTPTPTDTSPVGIPCRWPSRI